MGILSALFGRKNHESKGLVGCWHLIGTDGALDNLGSFKHWTQFGPSRGENAAKSC